MKWLSDKIYRKRTAYLERKKTDRQINSLVFLHGFLISYERQHTQTALLPSVLPHGTTSKPSYQKAMILGKWVNFIII